jgi:hypothetical protein
MSESRIFAPTKHGRLDWIVSNLDSGSVLVEAGLTRANLSVAMISFIAKRRIGKIKKERTTMNFNLQLKEELDKLTPGWSWSCDEAGELPLCVYATQKGSGQQTIPVLVSSSIRTKNNISETAHYVFKILVKSEPSLVQSSSAPTTTANAAFLSRLFSGACGCAVRWAQGLKGLLLVINPATR